MRMRLEWKYSKIKEVRQEACPADPLTSRSSLWHSGAGRQHHQERPALRLTLEAVAGSPWVLRGCNHPSGQCTRCSQRLPVGLLFYSPRPMLSCTALHYKSSACEFPNQVFYKKLQLDSLSCAYGCKQFRWNLQDRNKRNHKHFVARCCHGQGL